MLLNTPLLQCAYTILVNPYTFVQAFRQSSTKLDGTNPAPRVNVAILSAQSPNIEMGRGEGQRLSCDNVADFVPYVLSRIV